MPFARIRTTEESLDDPQVQVNEMVVELQDPDVGPLMQMGVAIQLSATRGKVKGPRVLPGTHQSSLLQEGMEGTAGAPEPAGE